MTTNIEHSTLNIEHRSRGRWFLSMPASMLDVGRSMFDVRLHVRLLIATMLLLSVLTGCQATEPGNAQKPAIATGPLPAGRPPTLDESLASDPCATRLENIEGAMLMYYALNKQLPNTLEDLKPFADAGTELKLTCPESKLPYVYSAAGLVAAGTDRRIIVWDPTPAHHGMRWCIVMPHAAPGAPLVPQVVPIQEKAFQAFVTPIQ
jgi:hypothetical protein